MRMPDAVCCVVLLHAACGHILQITQPLFDVSSAVHCDHSI